MQAETANRNMDLWDGRRCTLLLGRWVSCTRPAEVTVTWGCVHEHLHSAYLCPGCAQAVAAAGGIACHRCRDGTRPHTCTMAEVKQEPYDHEKRASQQDVGAGPGASGPAADR